MADEVTVVSEAPPPEAVAPAETVVEAPVEAQEPDDIQAKYDELLTKHARMEAFIEAQQAQTRQAQQAQYNQQVAQQRAAADPEPDVYEQPREHAEWAARQIQAQFDERIAQVEHADFNRRCNSGEEWLEDKNLLGDYKRLVNLTDPNNGVKQYLDRNPDVWRDLWTHNNPPKRLYQIAKDLEVRSPDGFESRVKDEVGKRIKDEVERAVAVALGKRAPASIRNLRPSVANLSAAPEGHLSKEPKDMSDEELSNAWRASWRQHRMG